MRAAVEWSYGLLSEQERELFDRLSVFFGGWTVEAAEVVCAGEGIDPAEVLDLLSSLIDKSLVVSEAHRGRSRQRLLEPLRQYAAERLAARGHQPAAHLRDRHAAFFLSRARRSFAPSFEASAAELEAAASQHPGWLDRLEHEHDNVRGALNWLLDNRRVEEAQRLGAAFWRFWSIRGHLSEGETWMRRIIDLPHGDVSTRIRVLLGAGVLAFTKLRTGSGSPSQDCG
jgi:non-specific serine/threonine protein kinase